MDRRKIIIIISILALGAILGGAYWYFSKNGAPSLVSELFPGESDFTTKPSTGEQPPVEEAGAVSVFVPGSDTALPRLYELHKLPVAGAGFIETFAEITEIKKKKKVVVGKVVASITTRYLERGFGYIFETPLSTYAESRIVNETRPSISEALWGNNGKSVVIRFIDDKSGGIIRTHILNINTSTISLAQSTSTPSTESASSGFLTTEEVSLPYYIPFMSPSEDGADKIFYLENGVNAAEGSVSTFKGYVVSKIFNSSFTEWLPQFPNQNLVTLTTKPSAAVPGHLFFVDPKTKAATKILGEIKGLTTLTSHDMRFVLFSETKGGLPALSVYNTGTREGRPLSFKTLPEKCAWGKQNLSVVYCAVPHNLPPGDYPDQWYQGVIAFSDDLWEINALTLGTKKIMSPSDFGAPFLDITNPVLSSNDVYLLFINKLSGTPWVYRIAEESPLAPVVPPTTATTTTTAPSSVITPDMKQLK